MGRQGTDGQQVAPMTWHAAYRIADDQVAYWQQAGITADEATRALAYDFPPTWQAVRRKLAAWVVQHHELWEE